MIPVSQGKPYAGNPHVRFEEGASAQAAPRRSALLHINEEAKVVFAEAGWKTLSWPDYYLAPEDSSLHKISCELPAAYDWMRTLYCGYKALVLRFGCHYNYGWLVVVEPEAKIFDKDNNIRRIADNVGVCFDTGKFGY